jgi:hypothetical protein
MSLRVHIALVVILVASATVAHADDVYLAQQQYTLGIKRFEAGDHAGALEACRSSYALRASPNSRLCIAHSLRKLGRLAEAFAEYDLTIAEGADFARYAQTVADARKERDALVPLIGTIDVVVTPAPDDLVVRIGDRALPRAAMSVAIPVDPGSVTVEAAAAGYETARTTVEVAAGETAHVELALIPVVEPIEPRPEPVRVELEPPPPPRHPRSHRGVRAGWITLAAGAAALAGGSVLAYLTDRKYEDLRDQCGDGCSADQVAAGKRMQLATNLTLGVGAGVMLVGGSLLGVGLAGVW